MWLWFQDALSSPQYHSTPLCHSLGSLMPLSTEVIHLHGRASPQTRALQHQSLPQSLPPFAARPHRCHHHHRCYRPPEPITIFSQTSARKFVVLGQNPVIPRFSSQRQRRLQTSCTQGCQHSTLVRLAKQDPINRGQYLYCLRPAVATPFLSVLGTNLGLTFKTCTSYAPHATQTRTSKQRGREKI